MPDVVAMIGEWGQCKEARAAAASKLGPNMLRFFIQGDRLFNFLTAVNRRFPGFRLLEFVTPIAYGAICRPCKFGPTPP
jgi:hypothetical protein